MVFVIDNGKGHSDKRFYFVVVDEMHALAARSILDGASAANTKAAISIRHEEFPSIIAVAPVLEWLEEAPLRYLYDVLVDDDHSDFPHDNDCPSEYFDWKDNTREPCTCWVGKLIAALMPMSEPSSPAQTPPDLR